MLDYTIVNHPDIIKDKLKNFDPLKSTWIVADLKSKQEIQNSCLDKYGYYNDESVLRVSDFWKMWLRRLAPQIKVVSADFIKVLVNEYILKFGEHVNVKPQETDTLYRYISDLAPLILHKNSHETLKDWLKQKEIKPHWLEWEIVAQNCLQYILNEHGCIESKWIVSFIQKLDLTKIEWTKKLIVDLGSQMTSLEMGIFGVLAQKNEIEIIVPQPEWKSKFNFILRTYSDYVGYASKNINLIQQDYIQLHSDKFYRFTTEINEVKYITSQIRKWIESVGIAPEKIVIISPRLEDYWPHLKYHLEVEGIPAQKDVVSSMISLGCIQRWISMITAQTKKVTWNNLEMSYTYLHEQIDYDTFKSFYFELLDDEDLQRSRVVADLYYQKIDMEKNSVGINFYL